MPQTIFYSDGTTPMVTVQDDGSIYHYSADGKKTFSFEGTTTSIYDVAENKIFEVVGDEVGKSKIKMGRGSSRIEMYEELGEIQMYGDVKINGSLTSL